MDYVIRGIPSLLVNRMWQFAQPYVKRALDHAAGEIVESDLRDSCVERDAQLWLVAAGERIVGAAVTELVKYPHKVHCRVITVAGTHFTEWLPLLDETLCKWAVEQGCDALEAHVRRGFPSKLAPLGYKHLHSVVHKSLAATPAASPAVELVEGKVG